MSWTLRLTDEDGILLDEISIPENELPYSVDIIEGGQIA
jgi:hypothetical protein